ncbi:MAG: DUF2461 domain-containing protein [Candidatus Kapaibacterium sp.]
MLDTFISEPFLGFNKEALNFFSKLKNNKYNNKKWFDAHRHVYEEEIKLPMRSLLDTITSDLKKYDKRIVVSYKSIFRINRDIRFKKDKTPYKSHYGASFTYDKIKTPEVPQFYFHISSDEFLFAAGQYSTDTAIIKKMRSRIYKEKDLFLSIIKEKNFLKYFGQVNGDKLKNIPSEYKGKDTEGITEYLKMKQFYVYRTYSPEKALSGELVDIILTNTKVTGEFNKFLYDSL